MCKIYYTNIKDVLWKHIEPYLSIVSDEEKTEIQKHRFEEDKIRTLIGKMLLLHILKEQTSWVDNLLPPLDYNEYKKPLFSEILSFGYFNITHAADWVGCAYSREGDIGLDIEQITPINIEEFRDALTDQEYQRLKKSSDSDFFRLWTVKEAIMKAVGKGFYLDPCDITIPTDLEPNFIFESENRKFYIHSRYLTKNYMLAVAKENSLDDIIIKEIFLNSNSEPSFFYS